MHADHLQVRIRMIDLSITHRRTTASCSSCLLHQQPFGSPTSRSRTTSEAKPSELRFLPPPSTTARHNLATSFTRALSEPNPIATHQQTPACARELASKRALHPIHNVKQPKNKVDDPKTFDPCSQFLSSSQSLEVMVGQGRFELPTSRLSSARSNQLSY